MFPQTKVAKGREDEKKANLHNEFQSFTKRWRFPRERRNHNGIAEVDVDTSERAMRVLAFTEPATRYQVKFSMPYCIAAAVVEHQVTLETFTLHKFEDRNIVETRKKIHLSFPDVAIWPGLADVGPDTEFVGNPVMIKTNDGKTYSARVDIPRGDPAMPLSVKEIEQSVGLVLHLEKLPNIGTLGAILGSATSSL